MRFDKRLLSRLLVEVGYAPAAVQTMWGDGEADSQNVPAMNSLLRAIASFGFKSKDDFSQQQQDSPDFDRMLSELKILASYAGGLFEVITTQSSDPAAPVGSYLSLAQLDRVASRVAHLLFVIFRQNGSGFVPAQNYYNTQITMRTKYVSQAVSMADEKIFHYWCATAAPFLHALSPHS